MEFTIDILDLWLGLKQFLAAGVEEVSYLQTALLRRKSWKVATDSSIMPGIIDVIPMLNSNLWFLMTKEKKGTSYSQNCRIRISRFGRDP